jgi:hypothetical protein
MHPGSLLWQKLQMRFSQRTTMLSEIHGINLLYHKLIMNVHKTNFSIIYITQSKETTFKYMVMATYVGKTKEIWKKSKSDNIFRKREPHDLWMVMFHELNNMANSKHYTTIQRKQ